MSILQNGIQDENIPGVTCSTLTIGKDIVIPLPFK